LFTHGVSLAHCPQTAPALAWDQIWSCQLRFLGSIYSYDSTYDQPVALALLAGSYISTNIGSGYPSSTEIDYAPGTLTITSGGALTLGSDTAGCAASGTIAQHNTPRGPVGVFDISLTFSGATCPLGNGTTGAGIAYLTDSGAFLEAIGYTASNTSAFVFRAHRAP
jgi:hypothetical protein